MINSPFFFCARSLDYVFGEQCISIQQYVISACVELHWRVQAFNKNPIKKKKNEKKNGAGHSTEGRAPKSQLKRIQIHPCACLTIMKKLLYVVIEFYDYT